MKKITRVLPLSFLLSVSALSSAGFVSVNESNFKSLSQTKPLVIMLSLGCDMGSYAANMFGNSFSDVEGITLGVIDANKAGSLYSGIYKLYRDNNIKTGDKGITLGTLILVHRGEVLYTSQMEYPGRGESQYRRGMEDGRRFIDFALRKHNLNFRMKYAPQWKEREKPEETGGEADLSRGLLAHYDFSSAKDLTGQQSAFVLSGAAQWKQSSLYMNGVYSGTKNTAYFTLKDNADEPFAREFTLAFRFIPEGKENFISVSGYNILSVGLSEKDELTLNFNPSYRRGEKNSVESWLYTIDDVKFSRGKWHSLILSGSASAGRLSIFVDGRQVDDLLLPQRLLEEFKIYQPGSVFHGRSVGVEFARPGSGSVFHGFADDIRLYNRRLNRAESASLDSQMNGGKTDPPKPEDPTVWNLRLLKAAQKGSAADASAALDKGADVNARYSGWTPLMLSAHYGHAEVVRVLISRQADPLIEVQGWNAEKIAENRGFPEIAALIENHSNAPGNYFHRGFPLVEIKMRGEAQPPRRMK